MWKNAIDGEIARENFTRHFSSLLNVTQNDEDVETTTSIEQVINNVITLLPKLYFCI